MRRSTHLEAVTAKLIETGVEITPDDGSVRVRGSGELRPVELRTLPYPGFPTDLQAQMMALLTQAKGTSVITETIFENRFMHALELMRMGGGHRDEGRDRGRSRVRRSCRARR